MHYDPGVWEAMDGVLMPLWGQVVSTGLQQVALLALAIGLLAGLSALRHRGSPRPQKRGLLLADLRRALALGRPPHASLLAAALGALAVNGVAMGVVMWAQQRWQDIDATSVELISGWLRGASSWELCLLVPMMVVFVPLCEELLFRGCIWDAMDRWLPSPLVLVGSTLLFAAFHFSPLHVLGVLPFGLFAGWIRLTSGSVYAPVVAHVVYNAGAVSLFSLTADSADAAPPPAAAAGAVAAVAGIAVLATMFVAWRGRTGATRDATKAPS